MAPALTLALNPTTTTSLYAPSGAFLTTVPISTRVATALDDGTTLASTRNSPTGATLYDENLESIGTVTGPCLQIASNKTDRFYITNYTGVFIPGTPAQIRAISPTGTVLDTWTLPTDEGAEAGPVNCTGIGVSPDDSILYRGLPPADFAYLYTAPTSGVIRRFSLASSTYLSDSSGRTSHPREGCGRNHLSLAPFIVRDNGEVLAAFRHTPLGSPDGEHCYVFRYSAAGALLQTYELGVGVVNSMARIPGDDTAFWVNRTPSVVAGTAQIMKLRISDGALLTNFSFTSNDDYNLWLGWYESAIWTPTTPPPPPPVPVPPTDPTNPPHCVPETGVGNGGSGHSGCNPGGTGHVPSYFGPWGTVPQHPDPVDGESMVGATGVDLWIEIVHTDFPSTEETVYRRSFVDLADPSSYEGGLKSGGLLGVGDIEHGVGNEQGGFEAATVEISYADRADRLFRRLLADQELAGDEVRIKIATIAGRESQVVPRVLARAVAQKPRLSSSLDASFSASDYLFSEFGPFGPGRQFPSWLIPESVFPSAPYDSLKMPIPVIYGEKSDEGAIDPVTGEIHPKGLVPLIYVGQQELETTHGVSTIPPFNEGLEGPPSSDVAYILYPIGTLTFQASPQHSAVTNYIANLYAAGTSTPVIDTLPLGVPQPDSNNGCAVNIRTWLDTHANGDYDVTVTAVTAEGESESGVSNSFSVPVSAESGSGAAGWSGPVNTDPQFAIMTVYQDRGSSLDLKRGPTVAYDSTPHNFRVTWTEAPQAAEYYVFMYTAGSNWDAYTNPYATATVRYKRLSASPTNSTDPAWDYFVDFTGPSDGLSWPPESTGSGSESGVWDCYLLAGHAIFDIISIYGSDLAEGGENPDQTRVRLDPDARGDILVPFFSRWGLPTTYRDFTAADGSVYRMTVIYATGPLSESHKNGEINLCVNCIGIEDVGDGSGLPIIDAHAVQQHWIENFLINNYRSGLWVVNGNHPAWEDGTAMVRSSSFLEAQYFGASRLGDRGLTVGWYAGTRRVLQDWFREWNQSTDTRLGLNAHGQIVVKAVDADTDLSVWPQVLHEIDLFGDVVQVFGEERENVVSGVCDWDPDKGQFRGKTQTFASERSVSKYKNRRKEGASIQSTLLVEPSHLQWVLQRRLARLQEGAKTVEITGRVDFLDYDVGTGIRLTTIEGTGETGYEDIPMLILRRRFRVADRLVTLTLLNVSDLVVSASQAFAIGDGEDGPTQGNAIGVEGDSVLVTV